MSSSLVDKDYHLSDTGSKIHKIRYICNFCIDFASSCLTLFYIESKLLSVDEMQDLSGENRKDV